jgi:biopolymer transport protein TolR
MSSTSENKPVINVTPLIDVLLVLLIIFMVVSPLRPHRFEVSIPSESYPDKPSHTNPNALIVIVGRDESLQLNKEKGLGNIGDPGGLMARLNEIFAERRQNGDFAEGSELRVNLSDADRVERTVFVKAPRSIKYGEIAKLVDSLKGAGASPISFQLDELE